MLSIVLWGLLILAVGVVGFLGWVVIYQRQQLKQLNGWLKNAQMTQPPIISDFAQNFGDWQGVYDELSHIKNSRQKRDKYLNDTIQRLNRMMAAMPSAMLIINQKGSIEWKNAKADDYLSLQNNKLPLDKQIDDENFHAFLKDGLADKNPTEQKLKLGQRTLICTLIPIEANATMLIAHDVSATEQLYISKNAFVANVSHELRTPLTVIQGFLETLADNELDRALQLEFIKLMQEQSERMLDLIEGLLTLSRLENDDNPAKSPINLSKLMTNIVKDARTLSDTHHITADIADDVWVMGVYKELYSAFGNLVFNAVRHTESGTQIDVHLSSEQGWAVFFVKDDGDGIDKVHLTHLTERFYRVDKGRSRKTGGSGLGLAIAKYALARHHATLSIGSEVGVGSVFGVKMPCKTVDE